MTARTTSESAEEILHKKVSMLLRRERARARFTKSDQRLEEAGASITALLERHKEQVLEIAALRAENEALVQHRDELQRYADHFANTCQIDHRQVAYSNKDSEEWQDCPVCEARTQNEALRGVVEELAELLACAPHQHPSYCGCTWDRAKRLALDDALAALAAKQGMPEGEKP